MRNLLITGFALILGCSSTSGIKPVRHAWQSDHPVMHVWCDVSDSKQCQAYDNMACPQGYTIVGRTYSSTRLHQYIRCGGSHGYIYDSTTPHSDSTAPHSTVYSSP